MLPSSWQGKEIFLGSGMTTMDLKSTQLSIQWVFGTLDEEVKWPRHVADLSPLHLHLVLRLRFIGEAASPIPHMLSWHAKRQFYISCHH
jgi:hypothetical protein